MEDIVKRLKDYPYICGLLDKTSYLGETMLIGGALRDYIENSLKIPPRDFDIVVDTDDIYLAKVLSSYLPQKNRFGGYKIINNNMNIDIWCLKDTWAFKEGKIACSPVEYNYRLKDTVFLNIDSIVYSYTKKIWYDEKYKDAMSSRMLDVVLEENPQLALNIIRIIIFRRKYGMNVSQRLTAIICNYLKHESSPFCILNQIQMDHYKRIIFTERYLREEIDRICGSDGSIL